MEKKPETKSGKKKYQILRDFRLPYEGKIIHSHHRPKLIKRSMKTIELDPNSKYTQSLLSEKNSKGKNQKPYIKEA